MFCNKDCAYLNKEEDRCTKFGNKTLPRNINNNLFRCDECKEENNEIKNQTGNNY